MPSPPPLWSFFAYLVGTLLLVAVMVGLSYVLGERHRGWATAQPYESGMPPTGSARLRFPVRFYLIAMFFVLFDLESVYLVAWAVGVRAAGWTGFFEVVLFVALLLATLVYLARVGALDWGVGAGRRQR